LIQFDQNPAITAYDTNPNSPTYGQCVGPYAGLTPPGTDLKNDLGYCPTGTGSADPTDQARVTYPGYAYGGQGIVDNATIGSSNYNGLQIMYNQKARKSLRMMASYTYSKSMDIQSNGQTNTNQVPMPFNLHSQYAVSDFNNTHVFNMGWVYTLPKTMRFNTVTRDIINGWLFGGIYSARTGSPINVTVSGVGAFTGEPSQRPYATPGVNPNLPGNRHRADKVAEWFNINAYEQVPNPWVGYDVASGHPYYSTSIASPYAGGCCGLYGNVGRNSLVGPAFIDTHFSLARIFSTPRKGTTVEFKADAFNVFNTPNLANPKSGMSGGVSNVSISTFGVILNTVGTNGNVGTNGRRMQISLVLHY
jgi:hypothetical protein